MIGLAVGAFFAISLILRIWLPYDAVLGGDWVRFGGTDPWYHLRIVENMLENFPRSLTLDPYTFYPHGYTSHFGPVYDQLMATVAWVLGLGSPSPQLIEKVIAISPAIIGALVTVPVYFIGRVMFNWRVGLIAAALIAILPGGFMRRSILGFSDHHALEALLSTTAVLLLILALKHAQSKGLSFTDLAHRDWRKLARPLIYAVLAGVALGLYLLTWTGGLLFVFIVALYAVIQYIANHLRGKSTDYLLVSIGVCFFITLLMILPFVNLRIIDALHIGSVVAVILGLGVLTGVSRLMDARGIRRVYYPAVLAGLGGLGLLLFSLVAYSSLDSAWSSASRIFSPGATIGEAQPLFLYDNGFSFAPVWRQYAITFYLAFIALCLLIYTMIRKWRPEHILLVSWSLVTFYAMMAQGRFSYYFAINAALLTGFISWVALRWIASKASSWWAEDLVARLRERRQAEERRSKRKKGRPRQRTGLRTYIHMRPGLRHGVMGISLIALFFLAFFPNLTTAIDLAKNPWSIDDDMHASLVWLRENTPEPFGDPDFYYARYHSPPSGEDYAYPASAYGIMNWWDHGHWITAIAHRIPISNPFQVGAPEAGSFFTARDEASANEIMNNLGCKYVIVDNDMPILKLGNMSTWADKDYEQFIATYIQRGQDGELHKGHIPQPGYYESMAVRLYFFNGLAAVPDYTPVISYTWREDGDRVITGIERFDTYEEAVEYIESQDGSNLQIVGDSLSRSPIPLEPLEHYQLIYDSPSHRVKIFEYVP